MHSLRNRLALVFFAITFVAIAALYTYVAPGLQNRLLDEKLSALATSARTYSAPIKSTVGGHETASTVQERVNTAALKSGNNVTVMYVDRVGSEPQLVPAANSNPQATGGLAFPLAFRAAQSGKLETGTESPPGTGTFAEAAYPVISNGTGEVIVYSSSVSDVVHNVSTVRGEILAAGGIALLLALIGGYLVARWLTWRVKRLELAAEQVAAGNFSYPIPVDSSDELGQLAVTFNDMQRQLAQLESAREKFIATASHELRTPIFSLGGFVELLEDDELDPETRRRFLDQVRDQTERLRKLSVDLLDLSRLEAGSLELREEQVDLSELTRSVSGEFEPSLAQHDSHLELRLITGAIEAHCDPVRVAQIMRIMLENALVHTPSGTRIVVTAGRSNGHVQDRRAGQRQRHRGDGDAADLRAVLHGRRCAGLGSRSGDRIRAGRADGGPAVGPVGSGQHRVYARAPGLTPAGNRPMGQRGPRAISSRRPSPSGFLMLQPVAVAQKSLADYQSISGRELIDEIRERAERLKGKRVLHLSATSFGGGVAEILMTLVPLMIDVGLECEWDVIYGREEFFNATKIMHNSLQGNPQDLSEEQWATWLRYNEINASQMSDGWDLCIVHDPQPAAVPPWCLGRLGPGSGDVTSTSRLPIRHARAPRARTSSRIPQRFSTWSSTCPAGMDGRSHIIPPAIDPLAPKNMAFSPDDAVYICQQFGIDVDRPLLCQVLGSIPGRTLSA